MFEIYNEVIYRPILNLLVGLYDIIPGQDIGIVIILVTIIIRLILAPLMHKSLKGQRAMSSIQPKLNEIREKHKDDREAQTKAMMDLYKEHNINPFSSCLPVLIQLPFLIALYNVFNKALKGNLDGLYSFVPNPGTLNPEFLSLIDLSQPFIYLAIIAAIAQYWQSRMMISWQSTQSTDPTVKIMNSQMLYFMPAITIFFAWYFSLPAGLMLYWVITTLFSIGQQYYIQRVHPQSAN